jgi:hypothetical protein
MKPVRIVVIPLLLLVFIVGGILLTYFINRDHTSYWDLLPENALLVYYSERTPTTVEEEDLTFAPERMSGISEELSQVEYLLDTLLADTHDAQIWRSSLFCYSSVHPINKSRTGNLHLLKLDKNGEVLLQRLRNGSSIVSKLYSKRVFNQTDLYERKINDSVKFTVMVYKEWIATSFEPLLVEDLVRKITTKNSKPSFQTMNPVLFKVAAGQPAGVRIYAMLPALLERFTASDSFAKAVAGGAYLDKSSMPGVCTYTGYLESPSPQQLVRHLQGNRPQQPTLWHLIPSQCLTVEFFGFDNGISLFKQLQRADSSGAYTVFSGWNEWRTLYQYDPIQLYEEIRNELYRIRLNYGGAESQAQLLLIKMDSTGAIRTLNKLRDRLALEASDTAYIEQYGEAEIAQLSMKGLPEKLFGRIFSGFDETYSTLIGDTWILSDDLPALKWYLTAVKNGEVWSRDPQLKEWYETSVGTTNYFITGDLSSIVSVYGLPQMESSSKWIMKNRNALSMVHRFSLQVSFEQGLVPLLSMEYRYDTAEKTSASIPNETLDTAKVQQVSLESPIEMGPFLLQSKDPKRTDFLVQDGTSVVQVFSNLGEKIWQLPAGESLVGKPIRLTKGVLSGSTALCFTSKFALVSDSGAVRWFDLSATFDMRPQHWSVFDYDQSGVYRFLFVDARGKAILTDSELQPMPGWNPLMLEDGLVAPPEHARIKNRDVLVAVLRKGKVLAFNRKGILLEGFPVDIKQALTDGVAIRIGSSLEKSTINVLSQPGEYYRITFEGNVLLKKTLVKPDKYTKLQLVKGTTNGTWSIMQFSKGTLQIFDDKAEAESTIDGLELEEPFFEWLPGKKNQTLLLIKNNPDRYCLLLNPTDKQGEIQKFDQCVGISLLLQEGMHRMVFTKSSALYIESKVLR